MKNKYVYSYKGVLKRLLCRIGIHWHAEWKWTGVHEWRCKLCGKEWLDG